MKKIKTIKKYKKLFSDSSQKPSTEDLGQAEDKTKLALKYALDIRKFEIDLYWRRTAYFWTLITVAFAGYFTVSEGTDSSLDAFIIACLGLILSVAWYLVNRGSKYWQENWEMHVDCLEDDWIGPLYKTTKSRKKLSIFKLHTGYPFSVSKVNQLVSLFAIFVWLLLIMKVVPNKGVCFLSVLYENPRLTVAAFTLASLVILIWLSNGKKSKWRRIVDFENQKLKDS